MRFRQTVVDRIRLHVAEDGPDDGPLVVLLHGFPEYWGAWTLYLPALADAGFRAVAPDQRGYGLSEKPPDLASYNLDLLAGDVAGLIADAGRTSAYVVGHDWGGAVAWWLANTRPELVDRLVILNAPHHSVMARALRSDWRQRRRSWYMFFFQLPGIPEWAIRAGRFRALRWAMDATARPGLFDQDRLAGYLAAWSQPGAATGMLNWYRAVFRAKPRRADSPRIRVPTLILWGVGDKVLHRSLAEASTDLCDDVRLESLEASHWVHHEQPDVVLRHLLEFLGS